MRVVRGNLLAYVASALVCLLAVAWATLGSPGHAYAYYNEVADSYPAAQDLGSYDEVLYGSDIPDGVYVVRARTSSRMCLMYTNYDDCAARSPENRELAVANVQGGVITVVFYLSSAYTRIYFGTDAEAASLSDGTDDSAYMAGDPMEGYEPHVYAFAIPALNAPMTIATYSGGDRGWDKGKWYTREVVFAATDDVYDAIENAAYEEDPAGEEPDPSEGEGGDDQGGDDQGGDDQGGDDQDGQSDPPGDRGDLGPESGSEDPSGGWVAPSTDSGDVPGAGGDVGDESGDGSEQGGDPEDSEGQDSESPEEQGDGPSDEGDESQPESGQDDSAESEDGSAQDTPGQSADEQQADQADPAETVTIASSPEERVGLLMRFVQPDDEPEEPVQVVVATPEIVEEEKGLTPQQVLLLSLLAILACGGVMRGVTFKRSMA